MKSTPAANISSAVWVVKPKPPAAFSPFAGQRETRLEDVAAWRTHHVADDEDGDGARR
jgi:hypothetical protein